MAPVEQAGALVWRQHKKSIEVLLLTSRDTGRFVIPKGFVDEGETSWQAAKREAWEEAGVRGNIMIKPLGDFIYFKTEDDGSQYPCAVAVFCMEAETIESKYPEMSERERHWMHPSKAAELVHERELGMILRRFGNAMDPQID